MAVSPGPGVAAPKAKERQLLRIRSALAVLLLVTCVAPQGVLAQSARKTGEWSSLIEGESGLDNFERIGTADWTAADGAVQATRGTGEPAYLVTKIAYRNFVVRAEFWASDDADSGILVRCERGRPIGSVTCYQVNIFDQSPDPGYGTGSIVYVARVQPMPKAAGRWNDIEITASGPEITVVLNGQDDGQGARQATGGGADRAAVGERHDPFPQGPGQADLSTAVPPPYAGQCLRGRACLESAV